ncbi:MAG: gliding motility protein GldL [Muribaculaceae bacterium]|nr:gliding motility protein GldL [Muribaculaceae bacterium]
MVKIRKYANIVERFLHGEKGQRFFNFAYSVGAAIVIWGALFKILHLPGGNTLLCVGMGTEIAMFLLTAFDRPPKEYTWEDVFPVLDSKNPEDRPDFHAGTGIIPGGMIHSDETYPQEFQVGEVQTVEAQPVAQLPAMTISEEESELIHESVNRMTTASEQLERIADLTEATQSFMEAVQGISEKMSDLNRNLAGLNTIYEIQLKNVSGQLETIDRVNRGLKDIRDMYEKSARESSRYCEETEKMARYMKQINAVYEKMITAMTINMHNPANPFAQNPEQQQ